MSDRPETGRFRWGRQGLGQRRRSCRPNGPGAVSGGREVAREFVAFPRKERKRPPEQALGRKLLMHGLASVERGGARVASDETRCPNLSHRQGRMTAIAPACLRPGLFRSKEGRWSCEQPSHRYWCSAAPTAICRAADLLAKRTRPDAAGGLRGLNLSALLHPAAIDSLPSHQSLGQHRVV